MMSLKFKLFPFVLPKGHGVLPPLLTCYYHQALYALGNWPAALFSVPPSQKGPQSLHLNSSMIYLFIFKPSPGQIRKVGYLADQRLTELYKNGDGWTILLI